METTKTNGQILLGDDELEFRNYLEMALKCQGYSVELAQDGDEVLGYLQDSEAPVSAVLLDVIMPGKDGMETLRQIRRMDMNLPVIIISGASSPAKVVEAMNSGATDFLGKPVTPEELENAVKSAIVNRATALAESRPVPSAAPQPRQEFLGNSPRMKEIHALIPQIGWSGEPVLIQGDAGVRKEVIARELHDDSPRVREALLKLNCAALPSELVESELFGYERGAFTGAFQKKLGMFELADGGTILLDEIGDMNYGLQAKLLQVLQDSEFQRVGGKETIHVDVRVIAATHCDLESAIAEGRFREDLYYRLNVVTIPVPPLRERTDEILALAEFFLKKHARPGMAPLPVTPALHQALIAHYWPGNIRELENAMRKYLVIRDADMIGDDLRMRTLRRAAPSLAPQKLKVAAAGASVAVDYDEPAPTPIFKQVTKAKEQAATDAILAALNSTRWNRKQAAQILDIDYKALLYRMKKLSIEN